MGHPKFARPKFDTPAHPWKAARIEEEHAIKSNHGLKNMREIWKVKSALRRYRHQAMKLIGRVDTSEGHWAREKEDMIQSMYNKGLITEGASLDDVLTLTVDDLLARRLQALVYMKGLAMTPKQARQMITHGHICIGDQKVTIPGYTVNRSEEEMLNYVGRSPISNPNHSIRQDIEGMRATAEYGEEEPVEISEVFEKSDADLIAEAAAKAPSAEDTSTASEETETPPAEGGEQ